jgi:hypothetical protein
VKICFQIDAMKSLTALTDSAHACGKIPNLDNEKEIIS